MAESSSDSDTYLRSRASRRGPLRANHSHSRTGAAAEVSDKIHKLANTLQDTSRNLKQVDEMLGQYREYTSDQTEAITSLKENLEQSIDHLRSQRLSRLSGGRSASLSSLCASDLEAPTGSRNRRFQPTSPLKDYTDVGVQQRRRSRSAVRFLDEVGNTEQLHSLHQSLRDLSSDQLRLNDDLGRELSRRNRTDAETKRTLEEISARLNESQRQETVSERVERRLQQLEKEMRMERQQVESRQEQLGQVSTQLQEALKKRDFNSNEVETSLKSKLGRTESEKIQLEAELERYRRRLDQTEGGRETLLCQVEDLRSQLIKVEEDRNHLQLQLSQMSHIQREDHEEDRRVRAVVVERSEREKQELECQISELRTQLNRNAILSEMEELKRNLNQKEREKIQMAEQMELLTADMEKRERQQLRMLEQLKDIQSRYEICERERSQTESNNSQLGQQLEEVTQEAERCLAELQQVDAQRLEAEKKKEDLKSKAQESLRHWKLKCKKLERELEKKEETTRVTSERCTQERKEKEDLKCQLQATIQQGESLRKELAEVLARRAQQEEELHLKQVRMTEGQEQQMELERELRESQDLAERLQGELQRQVEVQQQLQEDREKLQEELLSAGRAQEKSNNKILELQEAVRDLSGERAELSSKLAQEEKSGKELRRNLCEAQKQAEFAREELNSAGRQLKMEREVHQRELTDLRSAAQTAKSKHDRNIQEMLERFRQDTEQLESHIRSLKAELIDCKSLVRSERQRVEKMKVECDKLSEEVLRGREEFATLRCKYQLAAQDAEEKAQQLSTVGQNMRKLEEDNQSLGERLEFLQTEQETILSNLEAEINLACQLLSRNSIDRFKAESAENHLRNDPHYWLAETKTKLQWLCEEVREREEKERKVRKIQYQQCQEQLKDLKLNHDSEKELLSQQIAKLEQQLEEAHRDRKDFMEKGRRRDDEMWLLQDRIMDLERGFQDRPERFTVQALTNQTPSDPSQKHCMEKRGGLKSLDHHTGCVGTDRSALTESTRMALDHLESVPEKLSLLDDMKDLNDSHLQREVMEERYAQYREIIGSLQQQLEDSKRRIQDYREEKFKADIQNARLLAMSSSLRANSGFLSSSLRSDVTSPIKRGTPPYSEGLKDSTRSLNLNGATS
ncbi:centrosomal protein of 128 kDa isoform X3 [Aquarana catesbeiana]|uniref:centrosomal protein of 128 kDa isoform X3 n=1 Tax=Aquarana catesbeiana TaxID=8400 RepID=UPI003CC94717